jgi:putative PIN family toxin of toxin-antitoxin system
MSVPAVVLDTNVLVAAIRSREGASFALLSCLAEADPPFVPVVSVPLVLEYEDAMARSLSASPLDAGDVEDLLDFFCSESKHQEIFYLWRPHLRDPGDDLVLEVAFAAGADFLVTFNLKDFVEAKSVGVKVITPQQMLLKIGR